MSAIQKIEPPGMLRGISSLHVGPAEVFPSHQPEQLQHGETALQKPSIILSRQTMLSGFVFITAGFSGLFYAGWSPRQHNHEQLEVEAVRIRTALPSVRVMKPQQSAARTVVTLPGDVQALEETTIYPRTTGYVKRWLVDIGDEVATGQLLAEIDIPEVRAQLQQSEAALLESKASLERARATVNLAKLTTNRLRELVAKKASPQQDLDDSENNLAVSEANVRLGIATVAANEANVQQIRELLSFSQIHSPFAGTVVGRYLETGKLVSSGNGTGQALFQIARTNPVRVFINVPQIYAPGVMKGMKAEIIAREMPGRTFAGAVTRTARAIDPLTRTLLTEIQVANEAHILLTGSYVQVRMEVEQPNPPLLIPASALVFNAAGTQVAVVGPDNRVQLRPVEIAGDFGSQLGISSGITSDDQVVINPGDRMVQDMEVKTELEQPTMGFRQSGLPAR